MRTSTKVMRLCSTIPAALAASVVAVIGLGFLPDSGLSLAFLGTLALSLMLARGWFERPAAQVLGFARRLRAGEAAVLAAALDWDAKLGLAPERVLVRLTSWDPEIPAHPIGRGTVIVEPWLIDGLYARRLLAADAATVIGHAVARQQVGPAKSDLAARLWMLPWTLLIVVLRQLARMFSWVPAADLAWHLRIVPGVVAVWQGFQPEGSPAMGITVGAVTAVSYLAPAADRAWRAAVDRDADRILAEAGLATYLSGFVRQLPGRSMERVHRIRQAAAHGTERSEDRERELAKVHAMPTSRA